MRFLKTGLVLAALVLSPAAFAQKKWDLASAFVTSNFHVANLAEFAADVEKGTQGQLHITLHANSSLFKGSEIKRAVQGGQVQAGEILMTAYENESAVLGVDGVPFLATSYADARKLYAVQKPVLQAYLEKQGIVLLYCVPWPASGIYSKRAVDSISDMRGIKWRAYSPATTRMGELMQAQPVTVQPAELSQALTTGVVEAFMTSTQTGVDSRAYEQVKYFYDLQAGLPKNAVFVNGKAFQSLSAEQQQAVMKAAHAAEERGWRLSNEWNEASKRTLREKGMIVSEPSSTLRTDVQRMGQQLLQDWQKKAGPDAAGIVTQYQQLRASDSQAVRK